VSCANLIWDAALSSAAASFFSASNARFSAATTYIMQEEMIFMNLCSQRTFAHTQHFFKC
jgi:hypothetical protein